VVSQSSPRSSLLPLAFTSLARKDEDKKKKEEPRRTVLEEHAGRQLGYLVATSCSHELPESLQENSNTKETLNRKAAVNLDCRSRNLPIIRWDH
jgi:hypothetical protein